MAKKDKFVWQQSFLGNSLMTIAYTPLDGAETSYIKFKDGKLYWSSGWPREWRLICTAEGKLFENIAEFTDLERDLLSSVVRDLGYTPGNR